MSNFSWIKDTTQVDNFFTLLSDIENTPCLYCGGCYLDSNLDWAACPICFKWPHCNYCADIDGVEDVSRVNFASDNFNGCFKHPSCPLTVQPLPVTFCAS